MIYKVFFPIGLDLQFGLAILFGSDMVHGPDVASSSEGKSKDIYGSVKGCLITTPSSKHLGMAMGVPSFHFVKLSPSKKVATTASGSIADKN